MTELATRVETTSGLCKDCFWDSRYEVCMRQGTMCPHKDRSTCIMVLGATEAGQTLKIGSTTINTHTTIK